MREEPNSTQGHLAFLLPSIAGGGAERLTIELMRGCLERGHSVDLVLVRREGEWLASVPKEVRIIDLGANRLLQAARPLRAYLRRERPVAMLAAMWPLTTIAIGAAIGLRPRPRIVVADHGVLSEEYEDGFLQSLGLRLTLAGTYRLADGIVGVSKGQCADTARLAMLPLSAITVVANPVPRPASAASRDAWKGAVGKRILTVGNLKPAKNHRLLIDAFARVAQQMEATLAIVGSGPERAAIESQVHAAGLTGKVLLPGFVPEPGKWYAGADLFALSSSRESLGNVLVEALHFGLPVVATDCPVGPAEVLGNGRWGRLVPPDDTGTFARAMMEALSTEHNRALLMARAADFNTDRAVDAYLERLLGS